MVRERGTPEAKPRQSRLGKRAIVLPKGVTMTATGSKIEVKGPKGTLSRELDRSVTVEEAGGRMTVACTAPGRSGPRLQGLSRALVANMVRGVSVGFERTLEMVGTGYRAEVAGSTVSLSLGYSHPTSIELPASVTATIPKDSKGTRLVLQSVDKAALGQIAATIRAVRPPEPYGGKGVRYAGEHVRRKAGKAGKGGVST